MYRGLATILVCLALVRAGTAAETPAPPAVLERSKAPVGFESQELPRQSPGVQLVVLTPRLHANRIDLTDPKHGWRFTVACYGYFGHERMNHPELRFRVYAQEVNDLPKAQQVCRLLLRLQELAWQRLALQVNLQGERTLNVWLCWQGNAGGEQWRNNLYLYSIQDIKEPVEWVREVAHEFSHAVIPGITGYTAPEAWANGFIGERLFLTWLSEMEITDQRRQDELFGLSAEDLRRFVGNRCLPLRNRWITGGFPREDFARRDGAGMGALIGLTLYIDAVYGARTLRSTFARLAEPQPTAFWTAFTEALRDSDTLSVKPPYATQPVWIWLPGGRWEVRSSQAKATLLQGQKRWTSSHSPWKLTGDGWYRLTVGDGSALILRRVP